MSKFRVLSGTVFTIVLVVATLVAANAEDFPLRAKYPDLVPISTEELAARYDDVIIVDARNKMEYNVIHMKGAANFLVGKMKKVNLLTLRAEKGDKTIVFYCNGHTCSKSYKASAKARKFGVENTKVYDAGIFSWAKAHPEKAIFFGKELNAETVKDFIQQKADAKTASIPTADLLAKIQEGYTLIDIRDKNEAKEKPINIEGKKNISFDLLVKMMEQDSPTVPKSKIVFIDNVGKQVAWLHFYLKKYDRSDFYFLKGGVKAWFGDGYDSKGNK